MLGKLNTRVGPKEPLLPEVTASTCFSGPSQPAVAQCQAGASERRGCWKLPRTWCPESGHLSGAPRCLAPAEHPGLQCRIDSGLSVCSSGCGFLVFTDGNGKQVPGQKPCHAFLSKPFSPTSTAPLQAGGLPLLGSETAENRVRVLGPGKPKQADHLHAIPMLPWPRPTQSF